MISKHKIRGRYSLACVERMDGFFVGYAIVVLVISFDTFNTYDVFFNALHLLHIFSTLLNYACVRHQTTSAEMLRILVMLYMILLLVDIAIVIARFVTMGHLHDPSVPEAQRHQHMGTLVRIMLGIGFAIIDLLGVFFGNLAQQSAISMHMSTEHLLAEAEAHFNGVSNAR
jgi:hypothetical protein